MFFLSLIGRRAFNLFSRLSCHGFLRLHFILFDSGIPIVIVILRIGVNGSEQVILLSDGFNKRESNNFLRVTAREWDDRPRLSIFRILLFETVLLLLLKLFLGLVQLRFIPEAIIGWVELERLSKGSPFKFRVDAT